MFGILVDIVVNLIKNKLIEKLGLRELIKEGTHLHKFIKHYKALKKIYSYARHPSKLIFGKINKVANNFFNRNLSNTTLGKALNNFHVKTKMVQKITKNFESAFGNPPQYIIKEAKVQARKTQNYIKTKKEINNIKSAQWFSSLNSSWLSYGWYFITSNIRGNIRGNMLLKLKTGKSYLYFNVQASVWDDMKSAEGGNGSGAGSVFWREYLDIRFSSTRAEKGQGKINRANKQVVENATRFSKAVQKNHSYKVIRSSSKSFNVKYQGYTPYRKNKKQ